MTAVNFEVFPPPSTPRNLRFRGDPGCGEGREGVPSKISTARPLRPRAIQADGLIPVWDPPPTSPARKGGGSSLFGVRHLLIWEGHRWAVAIRSGRCAPRRRRRGSGFA